MAMNDELTSSAQRAAVVRSRSLARELRPSSAVLEACRTLRVQLHAAASDAPKNVSLVGLAAGARYTDVALGLAFATLDAREGHVLIVDADFRTPRLHQLLRAGASAPGLQDVVRSTTPVTSAVRCISPRLDLLTAGTSTEDPAGVLLDPRLPALLAGFEREYTLSIFLNSPLLDGPHAALLASKLKTTVLLLEAGRDQPDDLRACREALDRVGATLRGFVFLTR